MTTHHHIPLIAALTALIIAALALCACSSDDEPQSQTTTTHTLLLCYPWTGSADGQQSGLLGAFNVSIDSITAAIADNQGTGQTAVELFLASSPTEATLSLLQYSGGRVVKQPVATYSGLDATSTAQLTQVLNDAAAAAPALSYSLIVGCHGTGWLPRQSLPRTRRWRAFGGTSASMLTEVEQLDSAIRGSRMGRVAYLCFDGCYMANVETAYALRRSVGYLLASTSELMAYGLPYHEMWSQLVSPQPDWQRLMDSFLRFYSDYDYPYGALSLTDCSVAEEAASLMHELNSEARAEGFDTGQLNPQPLDGYSRHVFFDMGDYLSQLTEALPSASAARAQSMMARLVPYRVCTPRLYSVYLGGDGTFSVGSYHGITISDPTTSPVAQPCLSATEWWQATH